MSDSAPAPADWVDAHGRSWRLELPPGHVVLRSEEGLVDLPAEQWRSNLYIASHGDGFIVRVEHFESPLGFVVSREQALPLLAHLGAPLRPKPTDQAVAQPTPQPLLWPKVSRLAVWALICSSLTFVPVAGLLPALAAVVLLILHRRRVQRSAAYGHSRRICLVAFVFVAAGLIVSALATWGLSEYFAELDEARMPGPPAPERNIPAIVYGLFVVLLSLTVHEAAHAITAWWLGDGLAKSLGRVTLNPLAHIDPFGTVLLPAILAWAGAPVFGYARPVPVYVQNLPRWRRAHILIALAGPGSNLLLGCASLMLLLGMGCGLRLFTDGYIINFATPDFTAPVSTVGIPLGWLFATLCVMLKISFLINVGLALFNLVPLPPLDGSWVLEHLFPSTLGRIYEVIRPFGMWVFLGAIYLDLFDFLVYPLMAVIVPALLLLMAATGM